MRAVTNLVPSAEADSITCTLAFPPLTWRAFLSRRYAAGAWFVPQQGVEGEFRNSLIAGLILSSTFYLKQPADATATYLFGTFSFFDDFFPCSAFTLARAFSLFPDSSSASAVAP